MYKAIDVGCGKGGFVLDFIRDYLPEWEGQEVEVTRMDGDPELKPDVLHDLLTPMPEELKGQFDLAYMSHVLEHIPWRDAPSVAKEVVSLVKVGGYALILVPSLEWASKEIVRGKFNMGVLMSIYGGQDDEWQYHKSGFTRPALKILADRIGMSVYSLKEGPVITCAGTSMYNAVQLELLMRKEE